MSRPAFIQKFILGLDAIETGQLIYQTHWSFLFGFCHFILERSWFIWSILRQYWSNSSVSLRAPKTSCQGHFADSSNISKHYRELTPLGCHCCRLLLYCFVLFYYFFWKCYPFLNLCCNCHFMYFVLKE